MTLKTITRGDFTFTVGSGGDLSSDDVKMLKQHGNAWRRKYKDYDKLPLDVLRAIIMVKRMFPGSRIE